MLDSMNPTLEQIILDWIGLDRLLDIDQTELAHIETKVYNKFLSDLRARVPELVEKIEWKVREGFKDLKLSPTIDPMYEVQDALYDIFNVYHKQHTYSKNIRAKNDGTLEIYESM